MLKLKPKQNQVVQLLNSRPEIDEVVLIGAVGTGKTVVAAHVVASICYKFANTEWYAWRKNNTVSRKTLIKTYKKTLADMNLFENVDWTWHDMALELRFAHNESVIAFSEADRTKDREQQKIKGIDATGNHIDEANELEEDTFDMVLSRKGRANRNGQPSVNLITMNPNNGWAKRRYYDKWENGTLPSNVLVIEFTIEDSWQNKTDIDSLYKKAKWWVERYIRNNWNYSDEDMSLITSYLWEKSQAYERPQIDPAKFNKFIGVDPKDTGGDAFMVTLIEEGVMTVQKELKIPELIFGDNKALDERPISRLYADELIKFAQQHGFLAQNASRIGIEDNGVGVGVRDQMRTRGWFISVYTATQQARNENYLNLRHDMDNGDLRILYEESDKYDDNTLQKQLFAHTVDIINEKEVVCPKKDVKAEIGCSPDKSDSLTIVNWCRRKVQGAGESKNNPNRLRW